MSELKQLIAGLIKGDRSYEDVSRALDSAVTNSPAQVSEIAGLLKEARQNGLPHHIYVALSGQIGQQAPAAGAEPDATVFAPEGLDATVYAPEDPEATVYAPEDPEATIYAGDDSDATRIDPPTGGTPAEDKTLKVAQEPAHDSAATGLPIDDEFSDLFGDSDEEDIFDPFSAESENTTDQTQNDPPPIDHTAAEPRPRAADTASEATGSGAGTAPTGAGWPTVASGVPGDVAGVDREFQEGDVLRGRFELMSKLGEGGMGAVWKGKDKLKEEARDRNPYVAIKLLQGDFKSHPEAFIALQRETAKQQRLAHPNIATVFDFDRDDSTGTVFMTMEVMVGQPMDAFMRKLPADGLPEEEAMPLIEQLCQGLAYAHHNGLVHSDLKPGNCFLTKDNTIKLLDFGIARASKTKGDEGGETTLFDPGSLGALTPTYATIEMFDAQDPDPRDDIYALAIMAHQLLTGRHPYGKKPAPKARDLGLKVESLDKLNKQQNKGLQRGLAFLRENRSPSVEEFLDSLTRKKSRAIPIAAFTIFIMAAVGMAAYSPIIKYMDEQEREEVLTIVTQPGLDNINKGLELARGLGEEQFKLILDDPRSSQAIAGFIAKGDDKSVSSGLAMIKAYPDTWQTTVKEEKGAKEAILSYYSKRISNAFSPDRQKYNFTGASKILDQLEVLFPDSAQVFQISNDLNESRKNTLADLGERYKIHVDAGNLISIKDQEDIADVLSIIAMIDDKHRLLKDENLPFRFASEVEQAMKLKHDQGYARADALLTASTFYAPEDGTLKGLRYDLDKILTSIANKKRIAALEKTLVAAQSNLRGLSDYQNVRDELVTLADLDPQNKLLISYQTRMKDAFDTEFKRLVAAGQWQQTEDLLFSFARLVSIPDLTRQRAQLSGAEQSAGFKIDMAARKPQVNERVKQITALLSKPEFTVDWETRLKIPYKELVSLQPLGSPELENMRVETAKLFLKIAQDARKDSNFNKAREFVTRGLIFYPGLRNFINEQNAIAGAESVFKAKRAEEERLAKLEAFKGEFKEKAEANDVNAANTTLDEMRRLGMPGDDPFFVDDVPPLLAGAFQRLADLAAQNDDFLNAEKFAKQGLALKPDIEELKTALATYQAEIKKREAEIRLAALFNSLKPIKVKQTSKLLAQLKTSAPERYAPLSKKFANARASKLKEYARSKKVDISTLAQRNAEFSALFPTTGKTLTAELSKIIEPRLRGFKLNSSQQLAQLAKPLQQFKSLDAGRYGKLFSELAAKSAQAVKQLEKTDKVKASGLLAAARKTFTGDAGLAKIQIDLPLPELKTANQHISKGRLSAAEKSLAAAKKKKPKHSGIPGAEQNLAAAKKKALDAYAKYKQDAAKAKFKDKSRLAKVYKSIKAMWSDNSTIRLITLRKPRKGECSDNLAGFGKKAAGTCWDLVGRAKGPVMVVVPAGGGSSAPFAISKYEISRKDLNLFCKTTKKCKVALGAKSRLPATNISVQLVDEYAGWLSNQTSKTEKKKVTYRLPTVAEWEYAANANGAQPPRKFNCRVMSGGKPISGFDLDNARSGKPNGWGLSNYIGNAQEWVRSAGSLAVRGGAYEDPLTKCAISMSKSHSGSADKLTGFRLVRIAD